MIKIRNEMMGTARFLAAVTAVSVIIAAGCSRKKEREAPIVPVVVERVKMETVPIEIKSFGMAQAYSSVTIKSQITGILTKVHFKEGQEVKRGDLLISIDSRPYEAALKTAQGNLEKDEAQLKYAQKEAEREKELYKKGFVSQEECDNSITAAEALKAAVEADKATVENAALQVGYCTIRSPIDGVAGVLYVDEGNLLKANDVTVAIINQISPIKISFAVPQENLPSIRKYMKERKLEITASVPNNKKEEAVQGQLEFIDSAIDVNTGTIRLWGTSANEKHILWPGQFVNVALILAQEPNMTVAPSQAVMSGQAGEYVYVVKTDNTVEVRTITVERTFNNSSVVEGLKAGETVVTDGQLRLVPGAKVQIKEASAKGG
jgi:multidrug efflux system membrane fusion protein